MSPEQYKQVEQLYHEALERSPDQRAEFLQRGSKGDASLRREVESLLAYDERAADFIEESPDAIAAEAFGPSVQQLQVGQTVGPYQVLSIAGSGGMGEVYVAVDTRLTRTVAIKLLPEDCRADPDRVRRFEREARVISTLNHPNIITIHEIGAVDGIPYLVTEHIKGHTLRDRLNQGPLTPVAVLDMGLQITAALDAAHQAGIVHRDIKPENIMVRSDGLVKVLDFGLAKLAGRDACVVHAQDGTLRTDSGVALGTMNYMAPEQALGKPVDPRTDLFSLGVVLYELLTGHRPSPVGNSDSAIPPPLRASIFRLLAEDPDARYHSALELREDLNRIRQEIEAAGIGRRGRFRRLSWPAAGVLTVAVVLGGASYWRASDGGRVEIRSLAVLPFRQLNAHADDGLLGFGIANEIITRVGQASRVTVRPTSAVRPYVNQNMDALTAARQLGVDAVVDGNFQRADGRIRFSAHLLRTSDGASIWAETVDVAATDILDMQKDVAEKIVVKLRLRLTGRRAAARGTSNPQAYEYFSKAVYYFGDRGFDSRSRASLQTAIDALRSAIELDPNYADARAQLAYAYAWSDWFHEEDAEFIERAKDEISTAEKMDSARPTIHLVRSMLLCNWRGCDVESATRELLLAQQIDPSAAHTELAAMYRRMGLEEKEQETEEAALLIDPTSTILKEATVFGRYGSARPEAGLEASQRLLKRGPTAWYYVEKMMPKEAAAALARGDVDSADPDSCQAHAVRALIPALQGRYREAEDEIPSLLEKARGYPYLYYVIARVYALQGKNEHAVKWLKFWAERYHPSYPTYARDPFLDRLRHYGPFVQFMAEMKERWKRYQREFG